MDYGKYLVDEILPHWLAIKKDSEYGGIFTSFDENANVIGTDKTVWFFGREMWSYAMAWRQVEQRPEYVDMCEHIYQFLKKCTPPDGRLPYIVTRDGQPKVQRDLYYSEMFCAMAVLSIIGFAAEKRFGRAHVCTSTHCLNCTRKTAAPTRNQAMKRNARPSACIWQ